MPRSVVLAGAVRCPQCSLPPRWCVCTALPPVETPLAVHVLIHRGEQHKPSSTGTLIARVVTGAACHVYQRQTRGFPAAGLPAGSLAADREVWILHPSGEPLPIGVERPAAAPLPQVVLLDGTWRQAGEMLRSLEGVGRRVCLPESIAAPSRYWLRDQPQPSHRSTAEALMGVFRAVGDTAADRGLELHLELHVYATLLSRGRREMAERYLGHSPLLTEARGILDELHARRLPPPTPPGPTAGSG